MQRGRTCDNKFFLYFINVLSLLSPKLYPTVQYVTYGSMVCLWWGLTLQGGAACESEYEKDKSVGPCSHLQHDAVPDRGKCVIPCRNERGLGPIGGKRTASLVQPRDGPRLVL